MFSFIFGFVILFLGFNPGALLFLAKAEPNHAFYRWLKPTAMIYFLHCRPIYGTD